MVDTAPLVCTAFMDNTPDLIVAVDSTRHIIFFNRAAATALGKEHLISGQPLETILGGWGNFVECYHQGIKSGDIQVLNSKNQLVSYQFFIVPFGKQGGNMPGELFVFQNVGPYKQPPETLGQDSSSHYLIGVDVNDVIWTMDLEGRFTYVSPSVYQLRGYTPEEVLQQGISEVLTPASAEIALSGIKKIISASEQGNKIVGQTLELEQPCKDGSTVWTEVMINAIYTQAGALVGISGVTRDITQRRKTERGLRESGELYHTIMASSPFGIIVTDQMGIIQIVSPSALQIFQYSEAEEMIGKNLIQFIHPKDQPNVIQQFQALTQGSSSTTGEYLVLHKDGSPFFMESNAGAIRGTDLQVNRFLIVCRDITERKQLEQAENHARQIALAVREAGMIVNSTLDFRKVLDRILEQIARVIPFDVASILLRDGNWVVITALRDFKNQNLLGLRFSLHKETPNELVLKQRRPVIVDDINALYPTFNEPHTSHIQSWMGIPLFSKKEIVGFLNLDSYELHHFTSEDQRTAEVFASQVSIAIENSRLYEEAQKQIQRQVILNEVIQSVVSHLNLDDLLDLIYQQVNRFMKAKTFMIASCDPGKTNWETLYLNLNGSRIENRTFPVSAGLGGYVIETCKPLFLRNSRAVWKFYKKTGRKSMVALPKSLMIVPLIVSERLIGIMSVQNDDFDDAYLPEDFYLFSSIAAQVSIALENAHLFARMEQLATTDELTGLYNRRHFFTLAEIEFERAARYSKLLSVIMLDIDHFKFINDTYGHLAGDEVLAHLASITTQSLRKIDIVGRYGGEEFIILLPESGAEDACTAAERLREMIATHDTATRAGIVHITVSLGVTTFSDSGETLETMLDRADQALYIAKERGRNCYHLMERPSSPG